MEGLPAGAGDCLIKPFDKNELLAHVRVGLRVLGLHSTLAARVKELEKASGEIDDLKLSFPPRSRPFRAGRPLRRSVEPSHGSRPGRAFLPFRTCVHYFESSFRKTNECG